MKIAVECHSPLLQKSLEIFLAKYLCASKQCDIVVRDEICMNDPRCFYISSNKDADLLKPFSKSQLIIELEKKYKSMYTKDEPMDFHILEKRIETLTQEYQENILRAVKTFYEK